MCWRGASGRRGRVKIMGRYIEVVYNWALKYTPSDDIRSSHDLGQSIQS